MTDDSFKILQEEMLRLMLSLDNPEEIKQQLKITCPNYNDFITAMDLEMVKTSADLVKKWK
ncbi:MAG: hypothetical protein HRT89_13375 [Lentisphaeria bacterium]|nr:hypothetical protein [Lentisphaeria bacterium]NQZ69048.1 hypothetical protein [Lentisphaeria bacterium]